MQAWTILTTSTFIDIGQRLYLRIQKLWDYCRKQLRMSKVREPIYATFPLLSAA